jgi:hypothetical protein
MREKKLGYFLKNSREIVLPLQAPIRRTAKYLSKSDTKLILFSETTKEY